MPEKLVDAIRRAGQRAKFVPAMRDGKPAQVYMVIMVRTVIGRGEPLVLVLPNNGVEHERRSVEKMQFMPGFFEGKPVPMRYVEPAFSFNP